MADRAEQPCDEARPEEHEDGDAVRGRGEDDRAEDRERDHDQHAAGELDARHGGDGGVQLPARSMIARAAP